MQKKHDAGSVSSPSLTLRQILPRAHFLTSTDVEVNSCCGDSRQCRPGDVFVAILGDDRDGHDYYREAVQRGAAAIVAERLLPVDIPTCLVEDSRVAYGKICHALADQPGRSMTLIGVTGTSGKTVTSELITSVLSADQGRDVGCMTTLRSHDSVQEIAARATTPSAPELVKCLSEMAANGCTHAVLEVSSKALAQRRTAGLNFDCVVLTNLRRDHLDEHGSVDNYHAAKRRILTQLKAGGPVVLNADDLGSQGWLKAIDGPVLTIGIQQPADITATVIERLPSEQTFLLSAGGETVPVRTKLPGDHHVRNCLAAVAVGLLVGMDLATVVRGIEALNVIPGRTERIECGQPFSVFVDYARTPDSLAACLHAVKQVTSGRVICVTGAPGDRLQDQRPLLGRVLERAADLAIITSCDPGGEEPLQIAHDILDGFDRVGAAHTIPSRDKAIRWAINEAQPGDSVVIAGKGNEPSRVGRVQVFDAELCRHYLYKAGDHDYPRPIIPLVMKRK